MHRATWQLFVSARNAKRAVPWREQGPALVCLLAAMRLREMDTKVDGEVGESAGNVHEGRASKRVCVREEWPEATADGIKRRPDLPAGDTVFWRESRGAIV